MFETIERIERPLVRALSPSALKRLDKWLRLHHPLVWRTRIHWVLWWIGVPSIAWCTLAILGPKPTSDMLDGPGLLTYGTMLGFSLSAGGVALWCRKQLQTPLGERRWTSHVFLTLANTTAVLALSLPLWVVTLPLTYLIAQSIPSAAFHDELQFHRQHDYWRCLDRASAHAVVSQNWQRLEASLARFGLRTAGALGGGKCSAERGQAIGLTLKTWNAGSSEEPSDIITEELEPRLESIAYSKQLWEQHDGPLLDRYVADFARSVLGFAIGLSLLLAIRSTPRHVLDRYIAPYVRYHPIELSRFRARLMPAWLARLDRHLRLHRPIFWATRAHVIAVYSMCWLAALVTAGILLPEEIARVSRAESIATDDYLLYTGLSALVLPLLWAFDMRRGDVAATSPATAKLLVDGFCLAVLPLPIAHGPLLLLLLSPADGDDLFHSAVNASYMVLVGLLVLSLCLIRNYRSGSATIAAAYGGILVVSIPIGLYDDLSTLTSESGIDSLQTASLAPIAVTLIAVFGLLARRTQNVDVATSLIVVAPSIVLYLAFTLIELKAGFWAVMASLLTAYPLYRYAVAPLVSVLAESRHGPQAR